MSLFTEQGGLFAVDPHEAVDVCSRVEVTSSHQVLTTIAIGHCKKVQLHLHIFLGGGGGP